MQPTINELVIDYISNNSNSTIGNAYKAGFTECFDFIEKTFNNKNIMLSLRAILDNKPTVTVTRRNTNSPDMVIERKDNKTSITLSQSYFDKADLQNNRIMCVYEPGDHKVYFIVHNDETLYSDFMTGKNIAQKDEAGEFILDLEGNKTYKLGTKTRTFQDSKTSQDCTLTEMLGNITLMEDKSEFNIVNLDPKSVIKEADDFAISSIWSIENKKEEPAPIVAVIPETSVNSFSNGNNEYNEELPSSPVYNSVEVFN